MRTSSLLLALLVVSLGHNADAQARDTVRARCFAAAKNLWAFPDTTGGPEFVVLFSTDSTIRSGTTSGRAHVMSSGRPASALRWMIFQDTLLLLSTGGIDWGEVIELRLRGDSATGQGHYRAFDGSTWHRAIAAVRVPCIAVPPSNGR